MLIRKKSVQKKVPPLSRSQSPVTNDALRWCQVYFKGLSWVGKKSFKQDMMDYSVILHSCVIRMFVVVMYVMWKFPTSIFSPNTLIGQSNRKRSQVKNYLESFCSERLRFRNHLASDEVIKVFHGSFGSLIQAEIFTFSSLQYFCSIN